MITLGFNLEKNSYRFTVLDGDKENPTLIEKNKVVIHAVSNISKLMDWYETTFINLIENYSPEAIGLKLSLNAKKAEIAPWYYPYGILHSIAYKKEISVTEFVPANFTASKFGLKKGSDVYDYVDEVIGTHPPHWDKSQKYSVLTAWLVKV